MAGSPSGGRLSLGGEKGANPSRRAAEGCCASGREGYEPFAEPFVTLGGARGPGVGAAGPALAARRSRGGRVDRSPRRHRANSSAAPGAISNVSQCGPIRMAPTSCRVTPPRRRDERQHPARARRCPWARFTRNRTALCRCGRRAPTPPSRPARAPLDPRRHDRERLAGRHPRQLLSAAASIRRASSRLQRSRSAATSSTPARPRRPGLNSSGATARGPPPRSPPRGHRVHTGLTCALFRSRSALRRSDGVAMEDRGPLAAARPVRPLRWVSDSALSGRSAWTIRSMSGRSSPRAATLVATRICTSPRRSCSSARSRSACARSPKSPSPRTHAPTNAACSSATASAGGQEDDRPRVVRRPQHVDDRAQGGRPPG